MPTIRISDENYKRLQCFAVPLEDTADDALGRVLDAAEIAKQHGLSVEPTCRASTGILMNVGSARLDVKLANKVGVIAIPAKQGKTMTRWELTRNGARFWLTKSGASRLYLPPRGVWPSDLNEKVIHFPSPRSGWEHYDWFDLHNEDDVEYALKILGDL